MSLQEALTILELARGAGRSEIRHAYARLGKIYHAETHPEEFERLHEAYQTALAAANGQKVYTGSPEEKVPDKQGSEKNAGTEHPDSPVVEHPKIPATPENTLSGTSMQTEGTPQGPDLIDFLLGTDFSIETCSEVTRLLYYRCRYDEISSETSSVLLRITNLEQGIADDAQMQASYESIAALSDRRKFLGVRWGVWKTLDWTCIVCHPAFFRAQYRHGFLAELHRFLTEETLNLRDGIRQELYFALCMAYGFFLGGGNAGTNVSGSFGKSQKDFGKVQENAMKTRSESEKAQENFGKPWEGPETSLLAQIEKLLCSHPKHLEYVKDLELWPECQDAWRIVQFCQGIYTYLAGNAPAGFASRYTTDQSPHGLSSFAAKLLLDDEIRWKEFIYDCLMSQFTDFTATKPSKALVTEQKELFAAFTARREEFRTLCRLRAEFSHDFLHLLDNHVDENYIYNACYVPLETRLHCIRERYLTKKEWKEIVCRPVFFKAFTEWLFPRRNSFSSVPFIMHYDAWKMLRACFDGSSPFETDSLWYLTTEFYFPEYEKRYQRELVWEAAHIEDAYFKEVFPIPALNEGKLDLLATIKNATPTGIAETEKIWGNLAFDADGLNFLTRITNALTHFNFLLVTQKREKEAVPGDAFCFLENEVLLYRKKENIFCRLTHAVFYDLLSWKFEAAAYPVINGKAGYDEDFLDTACKNLYYYHCYVRNLGKH